MGGASGAGGLLLNTKASREAARPRCALKTGNYWQLLSPPAKAEKEPEA